MCYSKRNSACEELALPVFEKKTFCYWLPETFRLTQEMRVVCQAHIEGDDVHGNTQNNNGS